MRTLTILAALPLLSACVAQDVRSSADLAASGDGSCFFSSEISGFTEGGPERAIVRIGFREAYELTVAPGCPSIGFANSIGIVSRGSNRICEGQPAELLVPRASGSGAQRCLVSRVRKLSDAEMAQAWGQKPAE